MKYLILICMLSGGSACLAQSGPPVRVTAGLHFNGRVRGLGTNDAGAGLDISVSLFASHRLHAVLEASAARFIGDKQYIVNATTGEEAKNGTLYNLHAGPELFITERFAVSVSYGLSWHMIRAFEYSTDDSFKYGVTTWLGKRKRLAAKLFLVDIKSEIRTMQYAGIGMGYKF